MADAAATQITRDFIATLGPTIVSSEKQALTVYYQMSAFPDLKILLDQHNQEIVRAIQQHDTPTLISIIQKVQSDFTRILSEQPAQIQQDTERRYQELQPPVDELTAKVETVTHTLEKSYPTSETVYTAKQQTNRTFISKLVQQYTKMPLQEAQQVGEALVHTAEAYPELPPQELVKTAAKTAPIITPRVVADIEKHNDILTSINRAKENNITTTEQIVIKAILESPEPTITVRALETYGPNSPDASLESLVTQAQLLANTASFTTTSEAQKIDYAGFFSNISKSGTTIEKSLAPIADTVFSLFPKQVQEAVITKVLGASWSKEISDNVFLQKTVGPLLQSAPIQQAIRNGNRLLVPEGKHIVLTKTQTFFTDVFVTIFHPQVSEVYLQLAGLGNTQMGTSLGSYYAGLLAKEGVTTVAKKGVKKAGTVVAEKAAGTTIGKVLGGLLGSEGGPVGAFIGSFLVDKVLGGIWEGAKKVFGFFTFNWLGKLISGNYETTPLTKDPVFIISAVVVGSLTLLFIFPLLPFSLTGGSLFQQTTQDNAYINGMGGIPSSPTSSGNNAGAGFSCVWSGPTPPTTTISRCPAPGSVITQRPYDPSGSHRSADAYDFGVAKGTPIYAAHDGYVVSVVTSYQPDQYQYASFGNNVVLVGTDTSGKMFCTNYAHLLDVAPSTFSAYQSKTLIHAGDLIAYSDTTGYTYGSAGLGKGPHLHFGYKGAGSLSLPGGCP